MIMPFEDWCADHWLSIALFFGAIIALIAIGLSVANSEAATAPPSAPGIAVPESETYEVTHDCDVLRDPDGVEIAWVCRVPVEHSDTERTCVVSFSGDVWCVLG